MYLFTDKYFSIMLISGDKPRPEPDVKKASDAEILASWRPFVAQSGSYEISGTTFTVHPTVAKEASRVRPGYQWSASFKRDGDTLTVSEKRTGGQGEMLIKLIRLE